MSAALNDSSEGRSLFESMKLFAEFSYNVAKTLSPTFAYIVAIKLADLKDIIQIVGGIVAIVCTVIVSNSTVRKNRRP